MGLVLALKVRWLRLCRLQAHEAWAHCTDHFPLPSPGEGGHNKIWGVG